MTKQDFQQWKDNPITQEFFQEWRNRKQEYLEQMPGLVGDRTLSAELAGSIKTIDALFDTKMADD